MKLCFNFCPLLVVSFLLRVTQTGANQTIFCREGFYNPLEAQCELLGGTIPVMEETLVRPDTLALTLGSVSGTSVGYISDSPFQTLVNLKTLVMVSLNEFPWERTEPPEPSSMQIITKGWFRGLKHLQYLNLSMNFIQGIQDGAFEGMGALRKLCLQWNDLATIERETFIGLENLQMLNLRVNGISVIREGALDNLKELRELNLAGNFLRQVGRDVFMNLKCLTILNLSHNQLKSIPAVSCTSGLQSLILSGNWIGTAEIPKTMSSCSTLKILDLSSNRINYLVKGDFHWLNRSSAGVRLKGNHLYGISANSFTPGQRLSFISFELSVRTSSSLQENLKAFEDVKVKEIDLSIISNNQLEFDNGTFQALQNSDVSAFTMADCSSAHHFGDFVFSSMATLTELVFHVENCVASFSASTLAGLYNLENLNFLDLTYFLSDGILETVSKYPLKKLSFHLRYPVGALEEMSRLEKLNLSYAFMSYPSSLSYGYLRGLKAVRELILSHNFIGSIDNDTFCDLVSVEYLDFSYNPLELKGLTVQTENCTNFDKLTVVNLNNTAVQLENSDQSLHSFLVSLPSLKELHLSHILQGSSASNYYDCTVRTLTSGLTIFRNLMALEYLGLSENCLVSMHERSFQDLPNLKHLDLGKNYLKTLSGSLWVGLERLEILDLSNNHIQVINRTTFQGLSRLKKLDLSGNPLKCNCDMQWFRKWIDMKTVMLTSFPNNYTCELLTDHTNINLIDFNPDMLDCNREVFQIVTLSVCVSVFICSSILSMCLYKKYKWAIKYKLFLWKINFCSWFYFRSERYNYEKLQNFEFDAFISYTYDDFPWVRNQLMRTLEENELDGKFKLCVKDRDFLVGEDIPVNAINAVTNSNKSVFVLSENFVGMTGACLNSRWRCSN
ncbi:toll-like receptor 13 [Ptychodera flava]|uniref:toll-like receptor 13 n=1 Tax=Ptychodera flava TaxID=63121 RepID=UPI00396A1F9B